MKKCLITLVFLGATTGAIVSCGQQSNAGEISELQPAAVTDALLQAPDTLGTGTLEVSLDRTVPLYRTATDSLPVDTLCFIRRPDGKLLFKTAKITLSPYRMYGGDSDEEAKKHENTGLVYMGAELKFRVLEATEHYYRIITNEETYETAVIKKNPQYIQLPPPELPFDHPEIPGKVYAGYAISKGTYCYESWEHLLLRAVSCDCLTWSDVYDRPNGTVIASHEYHIFGHAVQVSGDWIKLHEWDSAYSDGTDGWIRWTDGQKLLVRIVERAYL